MFGNLSTTAFLIWGGIFLAIALTGGVAAYLFHTRSRVMSGTSTSKISSARSGYVEFEGRVKTMSGSGLSGPLTNTPCLWYEFEITRQMGGHGGNSHSQWINVDKASSEDEFWLIDDTGQCVIDPRGAKVITAPAQTDRWLGDTARPSSGPAKRGSRFGLFPGQTYSSFDFGNGLWFSTRKNYRYMERRIPEGASLYVIGQFKTIGKSQEGKDVSAGDLLRSWKDDQAKLLARFDADGDGRIDPAEWDAARQAAEKEAGRQSGSIENKETIRMLGATGKRNKPFIISAISQQQLLSQYRLLVKICMAATVIGGLMIMVLIASHFQEL